MGSQRKVGPRQETRSLAEVIESAYSPVQGYPNNFRCPFGHIVPGLEDNRQATYLRLRRHLLHPSQCGWLDTQDARESKFEAVQNAIAERKIGNKQGQAISTKLHEDESIRDAEEGPLVESKPSKASPSDTKRGVTLYDLLESGFIKAGGKVYSNRAPTSAGTITTNGHIQYKNKIFRTPTSFARSINNESLGSKSTRLSGSGWTALCYKSKLCYTGKSLMKLKLAYLRSKLAGSGKSDSAGLEAGRSSKRKTKSKISFDKGSQQDRLVEQTKYEAGMGSLDVTPKRKRETTLKGELHGRRLIDEFPLWFQKRPRSCQGPQPLPRPEETKQQGPKGGVNLQKENSTKPLQDCKVTKLGATEEGLDNHQAFASLLAADLGQEDSDGECEKDGYLSQDFSEDLLDEIGESFETESLGEDDSAEDLGAPVGADLSLELPLGNFVFSCKHCRSIITDSTALKATLASAAMLVFTGTTSFSRQGDAKLMAHPACEVRDLHCELCKVWLGVKFGDLEAPYSPISQCYGLRIDSLTSHRLGQLQDSSACEESDPSSVYCIQQDKEVMSNRSSESTDVALNGVNRKRTASMDPGTFKS